MILLSGNPLEYKIAPIFLDENVDWDDLFADYHDEKRPEVIATAKKFIQQVQESQGYDVDCVPPWTFMSPYMPVPHFKKVDFFYSRVKKVGGFFVWKLNTAAAALIPPTTTRYKLVDVDKFVNDARYKNVLLTFTAKEIDASHYDKFKEDNKFKYVCFNLWGNDRVKGKEYNDNDDDGEMEDSCSGDNVEGEGAVITFQGTVEVWPVPDEGKDYKILDMRVKPGVASDGNSYKLANQIVKKVCDATPVSC